MTHYGRTAPVTCLLYVSTSSINGHCAAELTNIVECARSRNSELGVTGALVFTGSHFAQVLEGPAGSIAELMSSITADVRHTSIQVLEAGQVEGRRFDSWSMAYAGPSLYVEQHIEPLVEHVSDSETRASSASALVRMMEAFAAAGGVAVA